MKKYHPVSYYFVPHSSYWPILGSLGLFLFLIGIINLIHHNWIGHYCLFSGILCIIYMFFGWFGAVINESLAGLHSARMDTSYRYGLFWFITSEIAFFGIFFGALFYARLVSVPALGHGETQAVLWPHFKTLWPLLINPSPAQFQGPKVVIPAWGIPALNTLILMTSAFFITLSHYHLQTHRLRQVNRYLIATIVLGIIFLCLQGYEYHDSYTYLGLTLKSGIYGTTFFMLTGFHALHVTIGALLLTVILIRSLKGHFLPEHHFAFTAASWYWHFVDVIWLFLFVFVYWL